jgi:hypothetical protein
VGDWVDGTGVLLGSGVLVNAVVAEGTIAVQVGTGVLGLGYGTYKRCPT